MKKPIQEFLKYHIGKGNGMAVSDLCNSSFLGTFNASGFHEKILSMKNGDKGYGIDNCIRHLDFRNTDEDHKSFFLMGIYAERIAREKDEKGSFTDPSVHKQFFDFQAMIINQFFDFIVSVGINIKEVTATFFDGCSIGQAGGKGSNSKERDSLLIRPYKLASDGGGLSALDERQLDKLFPVRSLSNVDINPVEGALVGPRIEVAVRGFEIATIVFDYYRIENGRLIAIDYLGGYAIGMERLAAALMPNGHLYNTGIMAEARSLLGIYAPKNGKFPSLIDCPLFKGSINQLLSSIETLIHLSRVDYNVIANSKNRRDLVNELKNTVRSTEKDMGFERKNLRAFVEAFTDLIRGRLPKTFNEVEPKFALDVIGNE